MGRESACVNEMARGIARQWHNSYTKDSQRRWICNLVRLRWDKLFWWRTVHCGPHGSDLKQTDAILGSSRWSEMELMRSWISVVLRVQPLPPEAHNTFRRDLPLILCFIYPIIISKPLEIKVWVARTGAPSLELAGEESDTYVLIYFLWVYFAFLNHEPHL